MPDYFAILGVPERLVLDAEAIESSWRERTRAIPSEIRDDEADLHEARSVLSDPVSRLAFWLERRGVSTRGGASIEPTLMDLFSALHDIFGTADSVILRHGKATSSLTRALLAKEAISAQLQVQSCLRQITEEKSKLISQYPAFEHAASRGDYEDAQKALTQLKFLKKWEQQCQNRLLALIEF